MTHYSKNADVLSGDDLRAIDEALADLDLGPGPFPPEFDFTPADLAEMAACDASREAKARGYHPDDTDGLPSLRAWQDADQKRARYHMTKAAAGQTVRAYQHASDMTDEERALHEKRLKSEENKRAYLARKARRVEGNK